MLIENLRSEKNGHRSRVAATVSWEHCDRPKQDVYFETDEQFADALTCNPHAFLLACVMPAMRHGEARIKLDAEICPQLRGGLIEGMSWIRHWFGPERKLVEIEAKTASSAPSRIQDRAAFFFSGGIDSLATLRANRLNYPTGHPGSFKDGVLIYGLDVDKPDAFEHVMKSITRVAKDAGITLVPVYTNERYLDDDWAFWAYEFQGAALAAVAHALDRRLTSISIGSTYYLDSLAPWGSHPLLDPNFSSHNLRIRHDGIALSRFDKTRMIAEWEVGLDNVRVCNKAEQYTSHQLNCGKCEKCIRTMLALVALGALQRSQAFAVRDVTEATAAKLPIGDKFVESCYPELIEPLERVGRRDLARGVRQALARFRGETGLVGPIKRLDRVLFKDSLRELKRNVVAKRRKKK
jgi:hypothetical protein